MDVSIGGAWVSPSTAEAFVSGSWRTIQYGEAYIGGSWRTIVNFTPPAPPPPTGGGGGGGGGGSVALSLSATSIFASTEHGIMTTNSVTVTPSGGLAPYTYLWSIVSSDAGPSYTITAPGLATTAAHAGGVPIDTTVNAIIQCFVTDSLGVTATSGNVTASFEHTSNGAF